MSLSGFNPLVFFSKLSSRERSPAYFTTGEWTVMAWNPTHSMSSRAMSGLRAIRSVLAKSKRTPSSQFPFTGGAIGYVSYDAGLSLQGLQSKKRDALSCPLILFHIYDRAVLSHGTRTFVLGDRRFQQEVAAIHARPSLDIVPSPSHWKSALTKNAYKKGFEHIRRGIRRGEYYQMNFTYPFQAKSRANTRDLFTCLARDNPSAYTSYIEQSDFAIVSLSPERFVTVQGRHITTCPIKGTRPRGRTASEDRTKATELLNSEKEAAELNMITDLLRNDIGKVSVAGSVKVLRHRVLQKNPSVWHTYSVIQGTLQPMISSFDAFLSMFPGGSVTGCPKVAAMKEIDRLERTRRGPYCGSMVMASRSGFFDSSILIRTIVARKGRLSLGVGGGIVADSVVNDEWQETLHKAAPFLTR